MNTDFETLARRSAEMVRDYAAVVTTHDVAELTRVLQRRQRRQRTSVAVAVAVAAGVATATGVSRTAGSATTTSAPSALPRTFWRSRR